MIELNADLKNMVEGKFSTARELLPEFIKAIELVDSKQEVYGDSWMREGLGTAVGNLVRKASGIEYMYRTGAYKNNLEKFREDCLDSMNYGSIISRLLREENK